MRRDSRRRPAAFVLATVVLLSAGCASTFEPQADDAEGALVVGVYRLRDDVTPSDMLGRRWDIREVRLILREESTARRLAVTSRGRDDHLLIGRRPRPGTYQVVTVAVDIAWGATTMATLRLETANPPVIEVEPGSVANVGTVQLFMNDHRELAWEWVAEFDSPRSAFEEAYPETGWNELRWVNGASQPAASPVAAP